MHLTAPQALQTLKDSNQLFAEVFNHGTLSVEVYKPEKVDHQQPHDRDEIYVVIAGNGDFYLNGKVFSFTAGDFIFVPAGIEHRFMNFTHDFSTWVFFYGPVGGENKGDKTNND